MCSRIFEPKNVRTEFWYEIWFKFKNVYYHSARAFFRCLRVTRAGHVMYTLRVDKGGFICNMHTRIAVAFANWNFLLFLGLNRKSSSGQMRQLYICVCMHICCKGIHKNYLLIFLFIQSGRCHKLVDIKYLMTVFFPKNFNVPGAEPRETLRFEGNKLHCFPKDQS